MRDFAWNQRDVAERPIVEIVHEGKWSASAQAALSDGRWFGGYDVSLAAAGCSGAPSRSREYFEPKSWSSSEKALRAMWERNLEYVEGALKGYYLGNRTPLRALATKIRAHLGPQQLELFEEVPA